MSERDDIYQAARTAAWSAYYATEAQAANAKTTTISQAQSAHDSACGALISQMAELDNQFGEALGAAQQAYDDAVNPAAAARDEALEAARIAWEAAGE